VRTSAVPLAIDYRLTPDDYRALYGHVWDVTHGQTHSIRGFSKRLYRHAVQHLTYHMIGLEILVIGFLAYTLWRGIRGAFGLQFIVLPFSAIVLAFPVLIWILRVDTNPRSKARWVNNALRGFLARSPIHPDRVFHVTFRPELIVEKWEASDRGNAGGEEQITWQEVTDIIVTEQHAFFSIGKRGYLIVPWTAFVGVDAFAQFLETVRDFWRAGVTATGPTP
jgi:hypothetical protein